MRRPYPAPFARRSALAIAPFFLVLATIAAGAPAHAKQKKARHAGASESNDPTEAAPAAIATTGDSSSSSAAKPAAAVEGSSSQASAEKASPSMAASSGDPAPAAEKAPPIEGGPKGETPAEAPPMDVPADSAHAAAPAASWPVDIMPGSAFLRPPPVGLPGGSLWLEPTAWASQWPYYPKTGIALSGAAWVDTGYEQIKSDSLTHADTKFLVQQGRVVVRATPTYTTGSFFVQGQAELVANKDQSVSQSSNGGVVDTDDLWVRFGKWRLWDLQLGRYQGWEVYHLGMGLDLNTLERHGATDSQFSDPVDYYGVTFGYQRSSGVGNVGLHLYPSEHVRVELLGHAGFENQLNTLGGRPVIVVSYGPVIFKVGGEYRTGRALRTTNDPVSGAKIDGPEKLVQRGAGASLQLVLAPYAELGVNAGRGLVDHNGITGSVDPTGSFTVTSYGGFANFAIMKELLLGLGGNYTVKDDLQQPLTTHTTNLQAFAALQYLVWGNLYVKIVAAYDKGTWEHVQNDTGAPIKNTMLSGRVRFMYLF